MANSSTRFNHEAHEGHKENSESPQKNFVLLRVFRGDQRNPSARKSSRGSSKLQLPNDATNLRRYRSRSMSIFHSRHAKKSWVKENESGSSSSSMITAWRASHRCSAARTAAPSTLRKPCIFVFTSARNCRIG